MRPTSLLWLLSLAWLGSFTYDNAEDLTAEEPTPTPTCDVSTVTYTATISSILAASCRGCHNAGSPAGGVNLVDYAQVKRHADSGRLYGSISHAAGYRAMPLNGAKLSDCDLARFKKWIDAGAPNN